MRLARAPDQINIGDVVRNSEEDFAVVECFQDGNVKCQIAPVCSLQGTLNRAMQAFLEVLDGETLADIIKPKAKLIGIFREIHARK